MKNTNTTFAKRCVLTCTLAAGLVAPLAHADDVQTALKTIVLPRAYDEAENRVVYFSNDSVYNETVRKDIVADLFWDNLSDAEIRAKGDAMRREMLASVGAFPPACDLNPKITGVIKRDGYRIEKVIFESRPQNYVTGYVFVPEKKEFKPPYAGIVVPCGHSATGSKSPTYQRAGVLGALNGFVTLVFDPMEQGERVQIAEAAPHGSTKGHNYLGIRASLIGWNTARFRLHDGVRAIDYLCSRADVDADKIGVMGNSGGGTMTAYISAFDKRVKCSAPSGYISTMREVMRYQGAQDAEQIIFGQLNFQMNHLGFLMMRYPNPTLVVSPYDDYFPWEGAHATSAKAKAIYGRFGLADRVGFADTHGPHGWYEATMQASVKWMRRWLYKDEKPWQDVNRAFLMQTDFHDDYGISTKRLDCGVAAADEKTKNVSPTGQVRDIPGSRQAIDDVRDVCRTVEKNRPKLTPELVRQVAQIRTFSELTGSVTDVRKKEFKDFIFTTFAVFVGEDMMVPVWKFEPKKPYAAATVMVSDADRTTLADRVRKAVLEENKAFYIVELRGLGSTADSKRIFRYYPPDGIVTHHDEGFAAMATMLGKSYPSLRTEDLLSFVKAIQGTEKAKLNLCASGRAVIPAVHAYYLEPQLFASLTCENEFPSWRYMIDNMDYQIRFADVIYNAYRTYDWVDLKK